MTMIETILRRLHLSMSIARGKTQSDIVTPITELIKPS
ncbi:hypothetical protein DSOL_5400 [Desulfosporosinus metallidurans]|uniref:Uncharacterized protein n=1 Tax=Desulfosporosinus metallidurans TaxID=1888891 RepID=A0A1Q8QBY8_9FIRM|nr:hypothetical protein DSOL_5400 [Desulfosporosinus metallidurans]